MTLFRGYADDLPLMEWLQKHIWPAEQRLEREDVYWGTRLACWEMARSGTIRFWDMYWKQAETARAVKDAGLRAVVGAPLIDNKDPDGAPRLLEKARRTIDEIVEAGEGAVTAALAPHAIYTVSEPSLRGIAEISAEREVPVEIHLSETEGEVLACVEETGLRPAHYLDRCGLLGPRTLLAHSVWLDRDEIDLIVERGATMVTNPVANLKLAVGGIFPYLEAREAGAQVALGTDGAGSNNSLDMLDDVKAFALLQKHVAADPAAVTAREAWEIATGQRSDLVGEPSLTQGARGGLRARPPQLSRARARQARRRARLRRRRLRGRGHGRRRTGRLPPGRARRGRGDHRPGARARQAAPQ